MQLERVTGLETEFPRHALNLYRYLAATAVLLALSISARRAEFVEAMRRPWRLLLPGALLAAFQCVWVLGVYTIDGAGYAGLIIRSSIIFSIVLAFVFYREERRRIRSAWFLAAVGAGLAAVAGVALTGREGFGILRVKGSVGVGTALLLASSFGWGIYAQVVKRTMRRGGPLVAFTVTCAWATLLLVPPAVAEGKFGAIGRVNAWGFAIIVASGALCVASTQALYFWSVRRIGLAYTTQVDVAGPVVTVLFSFLIFGERLTAGQLAFGALLLASVFLLVRQASGRSGAARAPYAAAEPGGEDGTPAS